MSKDLPQFNISWRKFQYMRNIKNIYHTNTYVHMKHNRVEDKKTNKMHEVSWSI